MTTVSAETEALLRRTYEAFNRKDIEAVLAVMTTDVNWPNMLDRVRAVGHDAVRAYWRDQFARVDPSVEPTASMSGGCARRSDRAKRGGLVHPDTHRSIGVSGARAPHLRARLRCLRTATQSSYSPNLVRQRLPGRSSRTPCRDCSELLIFAYRLAHFIDRICCTQQCEPKR